MLLVELTCEFYEHRAVENSAIILPAALRQFNSPRR